MNRFKHKMLLIPFMFCLFASCQKQKDLIFPENGLLVSGIVFEDLNGNGIMDTGEKGIAGVPVSNQREVVKTDKNGKYRLPVENNMTIYASKPAGYDYLTDENNLPRFFYHHYPQGSPDTLNYPGIPASGDLPGSVDFPLVKSRYEQEFTFIALGDPQPRSDEELSYFRDLVVANIPHASADFCLAVGDVMFDNLDLYPRYNEILAQLNIPAFNLPGNHDLNFETGAGHCFDTFKRYYGPDYYSFSYGQAHFIILNTVIWDGKKTKTWWGDYHGGILPVQMTWLENILQHIPEDQLIIFAGHIPMYWELHTTDQHHVKNREDFFKLLKDRNHLLFLAGHMHSNEYSYFKPEHGWMGAADFTQIICGAVCGTWWGGPKTPEGIPAPVQPDGAPAGYFRFRVKGNTFQEDFIPLGRPESYQMRFSSPRGQIFQKKLDETSILVNVFAGNERTEVRLSLNGYTLTPERVIQNDPFIVELIENNRHLYKSWVNTEKCLHLWEAPLPAGLLPGVYRIDAYTTFHDGRKAFGKQIFEVMADPD